MRLHFVVQLKGPPLLEKTWGEAWVQAEQLRKKMGRDEKETSKLDRVHTSPSHKSVIVIPMGSMYEETLQPLV